MTDVRFSSLVPGDAVVVAAEHRLSAYLAPEKSQVYLVGSNCPGVPRLFHLNDTKLVCSVIACLEHAGFQSTIGTHIVWCAGPWIVAMIMNRSTPLGLLPTSDAIRDGSLIMVREDHDAASLFAPVKKVLQ